MRFIGGGLHEGQNQLRNVDEDFRLKAKGWGINLVTEQDKDVEKGDSELYLVINEWRCWQ